MADTTRVVNPLDDDATMGDKAAETLKIMSNEFLRSTPIILFFLIPGVLTLVILAVLLFDGTGTTVQWKAKPGGPLKSDITYSYVDSAVFDSGLEPSTVMLLVTFLGLLSILCMALALLHRAGVLLPGEGFTQEDMDDEDVDEEETLHASHALHLLHGPFLINTVIMLCLSVTAYGTVAQVDREYVTAYGRAVAGDDYKEGDILEVDSGFMDAGMLEEFEEDRNRACSSPAGYFGTISGISANLLSEGYVFMFVGICVNAVVILVSRTPFPPTSVAHGFFSPRCRFVKYA